MGNVLIPSIIAILIVLNTMVGSVMERKREIAVYTSVGLAPPHVASLFIAEALAFGIISSVLAIWRPRSPPIFWPEPPCGPG